MTTTTLYPAALSFGIGSAGGHTSDLVGGQTALSDSSDATYAEVWGYRTLSEGGNDYVRVDLPAVSDLGALSSIGPLSVRLGHDLTPGSPGSGLWSLPVFDDSLNLLGSFDRTGTPAEGSPATVTDWVFDDTYASGSFASALQAGTAWVSLGVPIDLAVGPLDWQMRYYEFALTIEYTSTLSPCYKTLTGTVVDGTASVSDPAYATLPVYTGPSILDLTLGFTATSSDKDTITFAGIWGGWNGSTVDTDLAVTIDLPVTADGSPHDYTHTFSVSEYGETLADIRAALADTGNAAVRFEASSGSITFSDVWVQVGHKCRTVYPLRRHPRADGYGLGPKRHYPPPESQRKAGGYK